MSLFSWLNPWDDGDGLGGNKVGSPKTGWMTAEELHEREVVPAVSPPGGFYESPLEVAGRTLPKTLDIFGSIWFWVKIGLGLWALSMLLKLKKG